MSGHMSFEHALTPPNNSIIISDSKGVWYSIIQDSLSAVSYLIWNTRKRRRLYQGQHRMKIMYDNSNNSNFAGRERTYSLAAISTGKGGRVGLVDREGVGWIEEGDMCVSACVRVCASHWKIAYTKKGN